jgi:hypothetical protein
MKLPILSRTSSCMQILKNSAFWIEWKSTKKVTSRSNFLCLGKLVDYTLFLNLFWFNFFEGWLDVLSRSPTWAVFIRKKTSIFWSIHGSKICHSCQILLKFHRIFHPTSVIRCLNCYWSDFYPKKNPIFLYKIFPYALADGPVTLYTANLFNLEINVNLVSYQNCWTFLLFLFISMHFDSVLIYFLFKFYVSSMLYLFQLMVLQSSGY